MYLVPFIYAHSFRCVAYSYFQHCYRALCKLRRPLDFIFHDFSGSGCVIFVQFKPRVFCVPYTLSICIGNHMISSAIWNK